MRRGAESTTKAPPSGESAAVFGTCATRTPAATTRPAPFRAGPPAVTISTRSPGFRSPAAAASAILTGARAQGATGRCRSSADTRLACLAGRWGSVGRCVRSATSKPVTAAARHAAPARRPCRATRRTAAGRPRTRRGGNGGTPLVGGTSPYIAGEGASAPRPPVPRPPVPRPPGGGSVPPGSGNTSSPGHGPAVEPGHELAEGARYGERARESGRAGEGTECGTAVTTCDEKTDCLLTLSLFPESR